MKNPAAYCNHCLGLIEGLNRCQSAAESHNRNPELTDVLKLILARVESPAFTSIELAFPTVSTQNDIIRRMQRTMKDIANDIRRALPDHD